MKEVLKNCQYFKIHKQNKFHAQLSWAWKKFYNLGAWIFTVCIYLNDLFLHVKAHIKIKVVNLGIILASE